MILFSVEDASMIFTIDVYTMGSIISGWVFTSLWLASAALLALRCLMVVDFQMIHVKVELIKVNLYSTSQIVFSKLQQNINFTLMYIIYVVLRISDNVLIALDS